jgi:hypothetical protein
MTAYIKLSTLEYPRHEGDIRLEHPEIREDQTWPNFPCPDTYALVEWIDPPTIDGTTQIVELQQPIQENGVWKMIWAVRDMTAEELDTRARRLTEQQL